MGLLGDGIDADIRRCAPKRLETGSDIIFEQVARQVGLCMLRSIKSVDDLHIEVAYQ